MHHSCTIHDNLGRGLGVPWSKLWEFGVSVCDEKVQMTKSEETMQDRSVVNT